MTSGDYVYIILANHGMEIGRKPWQHNDGYYNQDLADRFKQIFLNVSTDYSAQLFDSVYLYGIGLNKSVTRGTHFRDGRKLQKYMSLEEFPGVSGMFKTNSFGDRVPQYFLQGLDKDTEWTTFLTLEPKFDEATNKYTKVLAIKKIADPEWIGGSIPFDAPLCGFNNELCPPATSYTLPIVLVTLLVALLICVIGFLKWKQFQKQENAIYLMAWKIDEEKLVKLNVGHMLSMSLHSIRSRADSRTNSRTGQSTDGNREPETSAYSVGLYMGNPVFIQKIVKKLTLRFEKDHLILLKELKEMTCPNIAPFVGLTMNSPDKVELVWVRPGRQTLDELLANDGLKLDFEFKMSLLSDVIKGLEYLHRSGLGCHGRLSTDTSYVDSRMMVKLSGFGIPAIFSDTRLEECIASDVNSYLFLYHVAPEILKGCPKHATGESQFFKLYLGCSPKGDMFGFGILMYQVLFRKHPYEDDDMSPEEIVNTLATAHSHKKRPGIPKYEEENDQSGILPKLMEECWSEDPDSRPKPGFVKLKIAHFMKSFSGEIVEHMMKLMEKYTTDLEDIVQERTQQLAQQQELSENLLASMLPKSVSDALKSGISVEPEWFDNATIYFSDIVGFTEISAESSPLQIVELLNQLYSTFDKVIEEFDAYKVETIGDAYMVASGVPEKNGNQHSSVIAEMALEIRSSAAKFKIPHMPTADLMIRVGIHTGPVAAGVVGLTMPRYCLFGDSVNMASRMESTSETMKIQVSETTYNFLQANGNYALEFRGTLEVKGKGFCNTYWLTEKLD